MREVLDRLHIHLTTFLDSLGVDRLSLEMEGLGLRPLMSTAALPAEKRTILARRFYRLAQWSEILQGSYWLTVSLHDQYYIHVLAHFDSQDMDSEVFRYYSLTYKLDDLW
jgi:FKBP12-rapamycin complex-associated protein